MSNFRKFVAVAAVMLSACGTEVSEDGLEQSNQKWSAGFNAHEAHWDRRRYPCETCHDFSVPFTDVSETVRIQNPSPGYAYNPSLPPPSFDPVTKTCSNVQCHTTFGTYYYEVYDWGSDDGSFIDQSVTYASAGTPKWNQPMGCDGCHVPTGSKFSWHGRHGETQTPGASLCQTCHPTVKQDPATRVVTFVDASTPVSHFNGTVELTPKYKASCFNCH